MVLSRTLPTGFMADAAFLAAAKTMRGRHSGNGSTLHAHTSGSQATNGSASQSSASSSAWKICFKCGQVNTHRAPACPIISPTISESVRASVREAIADAPITDAARTEMAKIATNYYAKFDRSA